MESRKDSGEGPLTFCDVAACFSEEEWKLLHQWQEDLYNNVMKEIHEYLNSIGPLIATSIFSLKPKQKKRICSKDIQDVDMKDTRIPSSGNGDMSPLISFTIKTEEESYSIDHLDSSRKEALACTIEEESFSTDHLDPGRKEGIACTVEEESFSIDHLDPGRKEGIACTVGSEVALAVATVGINEEGETYSIDIQDCGRGESSNHAGNINRMKTSLKCNDKLSPCKSVANLKEKVNIAQIDYERSDSELKEVNLVPWQTDCNEPSHSAAYQGASHVTRSEMYNICKSTIRNENIASSQLYPLPRCKPSPSPQSEQSHSVSSRIRHHLADKGDGIYACSECGKIFTTLSNLKKHVRIHTGVKPPPCTVCGKSFSQLGALQRHKVLHTGERPYECNICGKSFNRTDTLFKHKKRHAAKQQKYEMLF